tara:strand:- start:51 stop:1064 length:1014 start_codon:yes stop_codon:yes gene_type:complete
MGIKDLNKFIKTFAPGAIKRENISTYKGKTLVVDTSIFLYKFKYSYKLLDSFLQQYYHFKKEGVELIYVFDGKPPKEKEFILASRKQNKIKQNSKIETMEKDRDNIIPTDEEALKEMDMKISEAKRKNINITKEDIINVKRLFDILGVKYIHHNCEADLVCCDLYKRDKVYGCISNDMDFLPSGTGVLIRNYNLSDMIDEYRLEPILQESALSYDKFVDLCILCGCDYTTKIPRLGFVTAYKKLLKYDNIESIIENLESKFKVPENFNYKTARKLLKDEKDNVEGTESNKDTEMEFKIFNEEFKKDTENEAENIKFILDNTRYTPSKLNDRLKIIYE